MTKVYQSIKLNSLPKLHFRHKKNDPRCIDCGIVKELIGDLDMFVYDRIEYKTMIGNFQKYGFSSCVAMISGKRK